MDPHEGGDGLEGEGTRLFDGVNAYISRSLPEAQTRQLSKILSREKARFVDFNDPTLTHYITDSLPPSDSIDFVEPRPEFHYVTPYWVERTIILGTPQEPGFYSPHPAMLFSGVVATASDLSRSDNEVMAAGISSLGGQWRHALTRDITHLFTLGKGSLKYKTAMHYKDESENDVPIPIKILVPHWFDDVVRIGVRNLPTEPYEWPEPRVFSGHAANVVRSVGAKSATTGADDDSRRVRPLSAQKKALYDTIFHNTVDLPKQLPASNNTWGNLKIMFGTNLGLTTRQREAHIADVMRGGGKVIEFESPEDELGKIEEADVYIAQYRCGRAFVKVCFILHEPRNATEMLEGVQAEQDYRESTLVLVRSLYRIRFSAYRPVITLSHTEGAYRGVRKTCTFEIVRMWRFANDLFSSSLP